MIHETQALDIPAQLMDLKRELRTMMNGPVSQAMRSRGLQYKLNFGVELPRLRELAQTLPHDARFANALWQEDIRECRLLATMTMPPAAFTDDLCELWLSTLRYPEEADALAQQLLSRADWASQHLLPWMGQERAILRYLAYQTLAHLLREGRRLRTRDAEEFIDHAVAEISETPSETVPAASAARRALLRYMDCGLPERRLAEAALRRLSPKEN